MSQLLEGIKVLDLTNVLAGPYACNLLAQMGADVIKIERPETGDLARQLGGVKSRSLEKMGVSFLAQNAGKRSLTLDLKQKEGKELFKKMVSHADVVVENFRAGVMDRLGLGYEQLREVNRGIIFCSISGFGQDGPMSRRQAYDQIIQGISGVMSITGTESTGPLRVGFPVCDTIGGLNAAFAICAALVRKKQQGIGEKIDVSMLESTLSTMGWVVSNWLIGGVHPTQLGNQNMTAAPSGTFKTKDGLLNIAANQQQQFESLAHLVGRADWLVDERFCNAESRKQFRDALTSELEEALSTKTASEWVCMMDEHNIPSGEVLSIPEILATQQLLQRQFVYEVSNSDQEKIALTRVGFTLGSGIPKADSYPPKLGEHTVDILKDIGVSTQEIERLKQARVV